MHDKQIPQALYIFLHQKQDKEMNNRTSHAVKATITCLTSIP